MSVEIATPQEEAQFRKEFKEIKRKSLLALLKNNYGLINMPPGKIAQLQVLLNEYHRELNMQKVTPTCNICGYKEEIIECLLDDLPKNRYDNWHCKFCSPKVVKKYIDENRERFEKEQRKKIMESGLEHAEYMKSFWERQIQ